MSIAGLNESGTSLNHPFGGLPNEIAGRLYGSQLSPLLRGFGLGSGPNFDNFQSRLQGASGPLADVIRGGQSIAGSVFPEAQSIGAETAARGRSASDMIASQVNSYLSQLPGFSAAAGRGTDLAQRYADQAFSPTANEDLFQMASKRLLGQTRAGEAARGLESSGSAQQAETDALRGLTGDFAAQQRAAQPGAIQGLQNAVGNQANLAQSGIGVAQTGLENVGQLAQVLQQQYGIPLQALGGLLNLLTAGQSGALGLTQATAPISSPHSKGTSWCLPSGTKVLTVWHGVRAVEEIEPGEVVLSLDAAGHLTQGRVAAVVARTVPEGHRVTRIVFGTLGGPSVAISSTHPLPDGRPISCLQPGGSIRTVTSEACGTRTTHDLLIESPTGVYFVWPGCLALGSTLDARHQAREAA